MDESPVLSDKLKVSQSHLKSTKKLSPTIKLLVLDPMLKF